MSDVDEFDEFYRGSRQRLLGFVYVLTGDFAEAQDAVQEAFIRAWQRWSTVSRYDEPEAWVRVVATRIAVSRWRSLRSRARAYLRHGAAESVPGPDTDTVEVVAALRRLPEEQRTAIALYYLLGCRSPRWPGRRPPRSARSRPDSPGGGPRSPGCSPSLTWRRPPMREDVTVVNQLNRALREVHWPEPAEIRARARRRSRRTAAGAAAAVLVLAGGFGYVAADRSAPSGPLVAATPGPPATVGLAEIPQEALLDPEDVPLKTGTRLGEAGLREPVRVDPMLESCGRQRGVPSTAPTSRYSRSQTLLPSATGPAGQRPVLTQDVYRIEPDQSPAVFGLVKLLLHACAEWEFTGSAVLNGRVVPTVNPHRWDTPGSDFAGDESVMVRHVPLAPRSRTGGKPVAATPPVEITMVVRVGDLVTVVATGPDTVADTVDGARPGGLSHTDLEALGRTAARRMCVAANPGC